MAGYGYSSTFEPFSGTSKGFWCDTCNIEFASDSDRLEHQQNTPDYYICRHIGCGQFLYRSVIQTEGEVFENHDATAHSRCPIPQCGETLYTREVSTSRALRDHYRSKHPLIYCSVCDRLFADEYVAGLHKGASHPYCKLCQQEFSVREEKAAHDIRHHPPYTPCPACGFENSRGYKCLCQSAREAQEEMETAARERQKEREWHESPNAGDGRSSWGSDWGAYSQQGPKPQSDTSVHQPIPLPTTDYYTLLGISSHASHPEIIKAAKKARIGTHPDRFSGKDLSPQQLDKVIELAKAVGQAADTLSDKGKRIRYDAILHKERKEKKSATTTPARSEYPFTNSTKPESTRKTHTSHGSEDTGQQPKNTFFSSTSQNEPYPFASHRFPKSQPPKPKFNGNYGWGSSPRPSTPYPQPPSGFQGPRPPHPNLYGSSGWGPSPQFAPPNPQSQRTPPANRSFRPPTPPRPSTQGTAQAQPPFADPSSTRWSFQNGSGTNGGTGWVREDDDVEMHDVN